KSSPNVWTEDDVSSDDIMIFRGQIAHSRTSRSYGGTYRRHWIMEVKIPGMAFVVKHYLYPSDALVRTPGSMYSGDEHQCLHNGQEIDYEVCDNLCRRLKNVQIRRGLCLNNVCFCEWKIPNFEYGSIYLSIAVSNYVGSSDKESIKRLQEVSKRIDSSPNSATQRPLQLLGAGECLAPESSLEAQQSCSKDECNAIDVDKKVNKCRYDGHIISEETCDDKCRMLNTVYGIQIIKGKCIGGECYCIYPPMQSGCSRKMKFEELEMSFALLPLNSRLAEESMELYCRLGSSFYSD
ncbi:hypothetical protein QAD02_009558, partial [Eretmocerus hayati]